MCYASGSQGEARYVRSVSGGGQTDGPIRQNLQSTQQWVSGAPQPRTGKNIPSSLSDNQGARSLSSLSDNEGTQSLN